MQLHASRVPFPVEHAFEMPFKVAQLTPLEQCSASRLVRATQKVGRAVHFHRNPSPIIQSNQRVDAVPGGLATMLFLYIMDTAARADFLNHVALELRGIPFFRDKSFAAGLPERVGKPWPPRAALVAPDRPLMQL